MDQHKLEQALCFWADITPDGNPIEIRKKLNNTQRYLDNFLDGNLPVQDYLGLIETQGVDMDNYEKVVKSNLRLFGFS
ncbi:MAG: hypothetical protein WBM32_03625 [Crocosphaera sp.]|jgi:hypothetical protein